MSDLKSRFPDDEERRIKHRRAKGCFGEVDRIVGRLDGVKFKTCPGNFYTLALPHLLRLQRQFEVGVLPYPGSLMDQPNKIIEVFEVIEQDKRAKMAEEAEKMKAKDRAKGRLVGGRQNRNRGGG